MRKRNRSAGLGKREVTTKVQCGCCTTKLPFNYDGYSTKVVPKTMEPLAVQALLFTLYSCLSAERWAQADTNPELSELSGLCCDKCGCYNESFFMLPLSEQEGFVSPPLCPGCIGQVRVSEGIPLVVLRIDSTDAELRLMLRRYRKAYVAQAAETESPEQSLSAELTF